MRIAAAKVAGEVSSVVSVNHEQVPRSLQTSRWRATAGKADRSATTFAKWEFVRTDCLTAPGSPRAALRDATYAASAMSALRVNPMPPKERGRWARERV
jgi:hypothetical protein